MSFVAVAVLGIGLVAMGDDIGAEMSLRTFGHLVCFGCINLFIHKNLCIIYLIQKSK